MAEWNPKWLAFLSAKGMTPAEAGALERQARTSLNAEFICATMKPAPSGVGRSLELTRKTDATASARRVSARLPTPDAA